MNAMPDIRELEDELSPPLLDLEQLAALVADDERHADDGDCTLHEGCRTIR